MVSMTRSSLKAATSAKIFRFRQSEALLRTVMENAAVGMALIGSSGRLVYANRSYAGMFGYAVDECIGLSAGDLVHGEDLAAAAADLDRIARGDLENYRAERRFRRSDGSLFWGLVSTSALRDERSRRPIYIIAQITDIDPQKRAEAALVESEGRWNFALEGAGQGVWDHDLRTKRAFYSRTWRTMRGFAPEEEIDGSFEKWMERVHPDDRVRITAIVARQNSGELRYNSFEYRERHRQGHWIWILSRGKPVEWMADGSVARIMGTDTDITGLKATEAALADEKEKLRVTLASISDGVIAAGADGNVTFLNPIAEDLTGWTFSEAVGRPLVEVFPIVDEATGAPADNPVAACLERGLTRSPEANAILAGRSGERRDVRYSAAPVKTSLGDLIGAVLVFQDVTASRAVQRELAHSAAHDGLTGLLNRAAFERRLDEACERARREKREHALCFVDLDRFKLVNDTAGHAAGDALLKEAANAIRRACRTQDVAARVGGDEFALILIDCPAVNAKAIGLKIVEAISALDFRWEGAAYRIGASVGVTTIDHAAAASAVLMGEADLACYEAKDRGRNQVVVFRRTPSEA
jgi:diguanylate cyclase (GGDEF)-like protein/PAS domain S-box-containing protein